MSLESKDSKVISVNFTSETQVAIARHSGMLGAWTGSPNPFLKGSKNWEAFNAGRKQVAQFSPLGPDDMSSWNPVDYSRNVVASSFADS